MTYPRPTRRALCLGLLALSAVPAQAQHTVTFADDLVLTAPPGFAVSQNRKGVALNQQGALRAPLAIVVPADAPVPLHTRLIYRRYGDARYTVEAQAMDGSGGDLYEMRARRILPNGRDVGLRAYRQSEWRPDFSQALDVLLSIRAQADH